VTTIVVTSGQSAPHVEFLLYGAIAGLCEAVGVAALYRGLAAGVMSIVAPVGATAPTIPVAAAVILGELPGATQAIGIALGLSGIAMIALGPHGSPSSGGVGPSLAFGLLTALGFGGFLVAMDAASEASVPWALLMARLTSVTAFATAYAVLRAPLAVRRGEIPALLVIGALIVGADSLYNRMTHIDYDQRYTRRIVPGMARRAIP
jgi:drug/metabolite transporter (DMT)-like permease